jgi:hypothetical protein
MSFSMFDGKNSKFYSISTISERKSMERNKKIHPRRGGFISSSKL